jgi:hypothetical protein
MPPKNSDASGTRRKCFCDPRSWIEPRQDQLELRERIPTRAGARTGFFSPVLNQFYLAVPQRGNQAAELRIYSARD